jgi:tRNA 2-thiouridine synthesizing protein A
MADQKLDAKGLNCPLPVLKAKKMINGMNPGDSLEILATDPGAVKDFEAFSRATGHQLVEWQEDNGVFRFLFKKSA